METQIILKTKPEENALIRKGAKKSYLSISAFIRTSALERAEKILKEDQSA